MVEIKETSISINLSLRPHNEPVNMVLSIMMIVNIDKTIKGYFG
jgi:23S rRNA A2030 N6-methylase RlmJ